MDEAGEGEEEQEEEEEDDGRRGMTTNGGRCEVNATHEQIGCGHALSGVYDISLYNVTLIVHMILSY